MALIEYELIRVFERNIPKFGIRGDEYRLRIGHMPRDRSFLEVVTMVHNMFERKYNFKKKLDMITIADGIVIYAIYVFQVSWRSYSRIRMIH